MIRQCYGYIEYEDGSASIGVYHLQGNLPFSLEEMEKWLKEDADKQKPIKKVKCTKIGRDSWINWKRKEIKTE